MLKIKYPKFGLFFLSIIVAYILFKSKTYPPFHNFLMSLGYFNSFFIGILFAFGFTTIPATAIFLVLAKEQNIIITTFIGGVGAMMGNLVIFKFIKHQFTDELEKLSQEKIVKYLDQKIPNVLKKYFLPFLGGIIIISPLPSEIGISILATLRKLHLEVFLTISYILNGAGIFIILLIGRLI